MPVCRACVLFLGHGHRSHRKPSLHGHVMSPRMHACVVSRTSAVPVRFSGAEAYPQFCLATFSRVLRSVTPFFPFCLFCPSLVPCLLFLLSCGFPGFVLLVHLLAAAWIVVLHNVRPVRTSAVASSGVCCCWSFRWGLCCTSCAKQPIRRCGPGFGAEKRNRRRPAQKNPRVPASRTRQTARTARLQMSTKTGLLPRMRIHFARARHRPRPPMSFAWHRQGPAWCQRNTTFRASIPAC